MILDAFGLDGQVALVTGAHRDLGQGLAIALAEAGADIVAVDRSEPAQSRAAVQALGRRFFWFRSDLGKATPDDLTALVQRAVSEAGRLDVLVNNAAMMHRASVLDHTEAGWDDVLHLDLKVVFFLSQAAGRLFVAQKHGKIINIASMLSFQGGIRLASYTAAKSGVAGITRVMANELAPLGVNVNAIAPGYMATTATAVLQADPARSTAILDRIPAGRWGTPQDLAGAVVFLASAASDYVHGAILTVDGGWLGR